MSVGFRASNVTSYNGGYLRTDKLHNDNGVAPQPTFLEKIYLAINEKRYKIQKASFSLFPTEIEIAINKVQIEEQFSLTSLSAFFFGTTKGDRSMPGRFIHNSS